MNKKLPISVNIATFNEERNIKRCLTSVLRNNPTEIIVVDASSQDETVSQIKEFDVLFKTVARHGLAHQRQVALEASSQPYIAIIDAHHILTDSFLETLLNELKENRWSAIQGQTLSLNTSTYWQRAVECNMAENVNIVRDTTMVGRPCIYDADHIKEVGFDPFFTTGVGCEDTDISIQFESKGFAQGIGTGIAYREHPRHFFIHFRKWLKYGRGDAHIIAKYPFKKRSIRKHQLWNYPIIRSWHAIKSGKALYIPYFTLQGLTRFIVSILTNTDKNTVKHKERFLK